MKKFKAETYTILMSIVCIVVPVAFLLLSTTIMYSQSNKPRVIYQDCEKYEHLKDATDRLLEVIYTDRPDYYLDVLCETDEYVEVMDILTEYPDSVQDKLYNVFH